MAANPNPSFAAPPRIMIVDDHDSARRAMRLLLERERHFVVCGEASNGEEAVNSAVKLRPDVIVMDVTMPKMNGLEAAEQLGRALPDAKVLLISLNPTDHLVPPLRGTIFGLVSKQDAAVELPRAVNALLQGDTYFGKETKDFCS